jgi:hypothetical protein
MTAGLRFDAHGLLWGVENGVDNLVWPATDEDIHNDNPAEELNYFGNMSRSGEAYASHSFIATLNWTLDCIMAILTAGQNIPWNMALERVQSLR